MNTKIGKFNAEMFESYKDRLISKTYKLLPLREENNSTLGAYIDSLLVELRGGMRMVHQFNDNPDFISLISSIEGMKDDIELRTYRSKVFECITIIKRLV